MPINCCEFQLYGANENCNCGAGNPQKSSIYNTEWLRRNMRNPLAVAALRSTAHGGGARLSDNESVVRLIASQIAAGQLRVCLLQAAQRDPGSGSSSADGSTKPFPFSRELQRRTRGCAYA